MTHKEFVENHEESTNCLAKTICCEKSFCRRSLVVKKVLTGLFFAVLGWNVFAGGTMDVSAVSAEDVAKIELIVEALEPEFAIQTALDSFPKSHWPLHEYLNIQKMKINRIFRVCL
jgi:hypothetical protein